MVENITNLVMWQLNTFGPEKMKKFIKEVRHRHICAALQAALKLVVRHGCHLPITLKMQEPCPKLFNLLTTGHRSVKKCTVQSPSLDSNLSVCLCLLQLAVQEKLVDACIESPCVGAFMESMAKSPNAAADPAAMKEPHNKWAFQMKEKGSIGPHKGLVEFTESLLMGQEPSEDTLRLWQAIETKLPDNPSKFASLLQKPKDNDSDKGEEDDPNEQDKLDCLPSKKLVTAIVGKEGKINSQNVHSVTSKMNRKATEMMAQAQSLLLASDAMIHSMTTKKMGILTKCLFVYIFVIFPFIIKTKTKPISKKHKCFSF